jgi:hypothetical protein
MATTIQSLIEEYARRYSAQDVDGVSALCEAPFLAIREGKAIHLPDGEAVRDHFATIMSTYRGNGGRRMVASRDRTSSARRLGQFHDCSLERQGRAREHHAGYAYDLPPAGEPRGLAFPVVHQPPLTWRICGTPCRRSPPAVSSSAHWATAFESSTIDQYRCIYARVGRAGLEPATGGL